jgi:hypothetical protein
VGICVHSSHLAPKPQLLSRQNKPRASPRNLPESFALPSLNTSLPSIPFHAAAGCLAARPRSTVCRFCLVRRRRSAPPLPQWWSVTTPLLTLIRSSGKLMNSEIAMNFRGEVSWFVTGSDLGVVPIFLWEGLGSESIADLKVEDRVHLYCSWLLTDLHFHLVLSRNRNICIQSHRSCLLQYRWFLASIVKCKDPSLSLFLLLLEQYIRDLCNKDAGQVTREKGQSEFPV